MLHANSMDDGAIAMPLLGPPKGMLVLLTMLS
jgi:hypothetical protein